jgi:hypothetical protein
MNLRKNKLYDNEAIYTKKNYMQNFGWNASREEIIWKQRSRWG